MRNKFIERLTASAHNNDEIILLIGDLGFGAVEPFFNAFPIRSVNCGIAEQNMAGMAAGLAAAGKHVFTYSIGNFPTFRCAEQLRNDVDYHRLPVTTVSIGAGVAYGSLGYSHHTIQDLSLMRSLPNTLIFTPSDPNEVTSCLEYILDNPGPSYLRLGKTGEKTITEPKNVTPGEVYSISIKKTKTLVLNVGTAIQSHLDLLNEDIDIATVPVWGFNVGVECIECYIKNYDKIYVLEDHLSSGGFYSYLCEGIRDKSLLARFVQRSFEKSIVGAVGNEQYLIKKFRNKI